MIKIDEFNVDELPVSYYAPEVIYIPETYDSTQQSVLVAALADCVELASIAVAMGVEVSEYIVEYGPEVYKTLVDMSLYPVTATLGVVADGTGQILTSVADSGVFESVFGLVWKPLIPICAAAAVVAVVLLKKKTGAATATTGGN